MWSSTTCGDFEAPTICKNRWNYAGERARSGSHFKVGYHPFPSVIICWGFLTMADPQVTVSIAKLPKRVWIGWISSSILGHFQISMPFSVPRKNHIPRIEQLVLTAQPLAASDPRHCAGESRAARGVECRGHELLWEVDETGEGNRALDFAILPICFHTKNKATGKGTAEGED